MNCFWSDTFAQCSWVMTQLNWLGSGLKCQVCNGPIGLCTNGSDNGESKECSKGLDACYFLPGGKEVFKVW